jgi:hypothetical protein
MGKHWKAEERLTIKATFLLVTIPFAGRVEISSNDELSLVRLDKDIDRDKAPAKEHLANVAAASRPAVVRASPPAPVHG